jgi:hypothetical protein
MRCCRTIRNLSSVLLVGATVLMFGDLASASSTTTTTYSRASSHSTTTTTFPSVTKPAKAQVIKAYPWRTTMTGVLDRTGDNPKPLKFGSVVPTSEVTAPDACASLVTSFVGGTGYALGCIKSFQYPLFTRNGGATWTIAGPYFSGPWADAGAGATRIQIVSQNAALAYGNQWIYATDDGGRHWYIGDGGTAEWASGRVNANGDAVLTTDMIQQGTDLYSIISAAQYRSVNGGRSWQLMSRPSSWPTSANGDLTRQRSYGDPAKTGTLVTTGELDGSHLSSESFVGRFGYALGGVDSFQYPVRTTDDGATWHVAGLWFAGPWADAPAFANSITAYAPFVAVAKNDNWFYVTDSAGQRWYRVDIGASPQRCWQLVPRLPWPTPLLECQFAPASPARTSADYLSYDGGALWALVQ